MTTKYEYKDEHQEQVDAFGRSAQNIVNDVRHQIVSRDANFSPKSRHFLDASELAIDNFRALDQRDKRRIYFYLKSAIEKEFPILKARFVVASLALALATGAAGWALNDYFDRRAEKQKAEQPEAQTTSLFSPTTTDEASPVVSF